MSRDLSPAAVAARLSWLRSAYVPMREEDARARMEHTIRPSSRGFAEGAQRRLAELRALCDLTAHLHAGRVRDPLSRGSAS
jgi:hypothetical protein